MRARPRAPRCNAWLDGTANRSRNSLRRTQSITAASSHPLLRFADVRVARRVLSVLRMAMGKIKALFWTEAGASAPRRAPSAAPSAPAAAAPAAPSPDLAGISANVVERLTALEASITTEQHRVRERHDSRAQALQAPTAQ